MDTHKSRWSDQKKKENRRKRKSNRISNTKNKKRKEKGEKKIKEEEEEEDRTEQEQTISNAVGATETSINVSSPSSPSLPYPLRFLSTPSHLSNPSPTYLKLKHPFFPPAIPPSSHPLPSSSSSYQATTTNITCDPPHDHDGFVRGFLYSFPLHAHALVLLVCVFDFSGLI